MFRNQISEPITSATNMSTQRVEKRYNDITKSQNDDRLYRGLVLANKMKVLLISDLTTDKSAVSMDINAGNYIILLFYLIFMAIKTHKNFLIKSFCVYVYACYKFI